MMSTARCCSRLFSLEREPHAQATQALAVGARHNDAERHVAGALGGGEQRRRRCRGRRRTSTDAATTVGGAAASRVTVGVEPGATEVSEAPV